MCGITGYYSYRYPVETALFYEAHKKLAHRGPDDEGFLYQNTQKELIYLRGEDTIAEKRYLPLLSAQSPSCLILGHRRLSIIDLSEHGHQPFHFAHLHLVYNGEIYNYIELREELRLLGYDFETQSDTEVFLKAYHCWGVEAFNRFNGMWASAIYDEHTQSILLVRDRFGIKPLYYSFKEDQLLFGSEIKFITSFFPKCYPNEAMVYEYLRWSRIGHTAETLFEDIYQLEPNHYLIFSQEGIEINAYWEIPTEKDSSKSVIESALQDAIRLRMRSDVEVGSLLSGGIDSSTILGIIDDQIYTQKFQSFSAVFQEESFSEKRYIDAFKTHHLALTKHFIYPDPKQLAAQIQELLYTQEEPFRSLAVFSQYEIYKYIKTHTQAVVLLNGQGADEIFTGYSKYYVVNLLALLRGFRFKRFLKEFRALRKNRNLSTLSLIKQVAVTWLSRHYQPRDKYGIFTRHFKATPLPHKFTDPLKNSLWQDLTFSALREYLRYEDKNSMRFSLESRLPFLDFQLVQKAFGLSNEKKIHNGISKYILRQIARDKIPAITLERKDKMGFVSPQEVWQRTLLKETFDETFKAIQTEGLFPFIDGKTVYRLYLDYQEQKMDDWAFIWRLYCLYQWKKVWNIDER